MSEFTGYNEWGLMKKQKRNNKILNEFTGYNEWGLMKKQKEITRFWVNSLVIINED